MYEAHIITAVIILLTLLTAYYRYTVFRNAQHTTSGKNVFIVGCSGAGKTVLFNRLLTDRFNSNTISSVCPAQGVLSVTTREGQAAVVITDVPSNAAVQRDFLSFGLKHASALIFVVDSSGDRDSLIEAANHIHAILSSEEVSQRQVPMLIFSSKNDLKEQRSASLVKDNLEREIERLRRSKILNHDDDANCRNPSLGLGDSEFFRLSKYKSSPLSFESGSSAADIEVVQKFIAMSITGP